MLPALALTGLTLLGSSSIEDWISIDDPDYARLPIALRSLPHEEQAIFESSEKPWFLIARRVRLESDGFAVFAADEKQMSRHGEFIPKDEDIAEVKGGEAIQFEAEWEQQGTKSRILALYSPDRTSDGETLLAVWLIAPEEFSARRMLPELKSCLRDLRKGFAPPTEDTYASLLNGHALSFALRAGRGRNALSLESVEAPAPGDGFFFESIAAKYKQFHTSIARNWRDDGRDLTLSYQVYQYDVGLAPKVPFLYWIAESLQLALRTNKDEGDVPIELLHLENALTSVVSDEEVRHHYGNNKRAPDAGVILQTFLPRSPYARACSLRWTDAKSGRPSFALLVELRTYPRSRSETVTRSSIVMLLARAGKSERLDALEEGIAFASTPLVEAAPLAELPH